MLRIGFGYDVHPLVEGKKLILGGVRIHGTKGLSGHSDGDVFFHALIDALLGVCGLGSIGELFPETEEYRNADSAQLLKVAYEKAKKIFVIEINNIDTTIVSKSVRISPIKEKIKENVAKILNIELNQINIKGKSGNTLGVAGKDEGIEVYCVILAKIKGSK